MTWDEKKLLKDYKHMLKNELVTDLSRDGEICAKDYTRHKMLASIIGTMCDIDDLLESDDSDEDDYSSDEDCKLTPEKAEAWAAGMENSDGTKGAHWTIDQTTAVAEQNGVMFDHITPTDWMITLNMIYSDYGKTLTSAGVTDVAVFAELAKDFLFDEDAVKPQKKLYYYYKYIVKK